LPTDAGRASISGSGLGDFPTDIDGNGYADQIFCDDRFAHTSDYADSLMPPRIFEIRDGASVDVSDSGRYGALFERDMNDNAWAAMLKNYDAQSNWDYPKKSAVASAAPGQCPKGQELVFANFPDPLIWFLSDAGYIKPRGR
jgi:hypothetical protein